MRASALLDVRPAGDRFASSGEQGCPGYSGFLVGSADLISCQGQHVLRPAERSFRQPEQLPLGLLHRLVGHDSIDASGPAAGHTGVERNRVGVPDLNLNALKRHLQLLRYDLTECRIRSSTLIEDRRAYDHAAVRFQGDGSGCFATPSGSVADGDTPTHERRLGLM